MFMFFYHGEYTGKGAEFHRVFLPGVSVKPGVVSVKLRGK